MPTMVQKWYCCCQTTLYRKLYQYGTKLCEFCCGPAPPEQWAHKRHLSFSYKKRQHTKKCITQRIQQNICSVCLEKLQTCTWDISFLGKLWSKKWKVNRKGVNSTIFRYGRMLLPPSVEGSSFFCPCNHAVHFNLSKRALFVENKWHSILTLCLLHSLLLI